MSKLVAGMIGCGAFARGQHLPNCAKNSHVRMKWACDLFGDVVERTQKDFSIPNGTTDPNDIFNDPEVGLVLLATSHEAHLGLIEAAAKKGKHVLCEKPLAMTLEDCNKIIRIVRRHGIKLAVDYNRRCSAALIDLKRQYQDFKRNGQHNPWRYTEAKRPSYPGEMNTTFLIRIQDDSLSYRMVHMDPELGGGIMIGEDCHHHDLFAWFFDDDEPVSVQAWGLIVASHGVNVQFRSGNSGTLLFHIGGTFDYPKELFEITYNGALFRSECYLETNVYGVKGGGRKTFALQHDGIPEIGKQGGVAGFLEKQKALVGGLANAKEKWGAVNMDKGHENLLNLFVDAILNDNPSPCNEIDGLRATYLATLAMESVRTGNIMPVEPRHWNPMIHVR